MEGLLLFSKKVDFIWPAAVDIALRLQGVGLIGERYCIDDVVRYLPGEFFLELISFLGCSPHVRLAPEENHPFCSVEIITSIHQPKFLGSHHPDIRPPRCPKCRTPVLHWERLVALWQQGDDTVRWDCPTCCESFALTAIHWRRRAAFASSFVIIHNIFDGEAVPSEKLLNFFEDASGTAWDYCYIA